MGYLRIPCHRYPPPLTSPPPEQPINLTPLTLPHPTYLTSPHPAFTASRDITVGEELFVDVRTDPATLRRYVPSSPGQFGSYCLSN